MQARGIPTLDGWRAVSVLFVVGGHFANYRFNSGQESHFVKYISVLGVEIFFVISGFLITTLALQEKQARGRFSAPAFWGRRIFRIVPACFVYLLAVLALSTAGALDPRESDGVGTAALFLCNVAKNACGWFVAHTWSLAYEQQFYLAFPLLLLLPGSALRHVAILYAAFVTVSLLALIAGPASVWDAAHQFLSYFSYICAGALFACIPDLLTRLLARDRRNLLTVAACATLVFFVITLGIGRIAMHVESRTTLALQAAILPLALAWLIHRTSVSQGLTRRLLELPPMRFVGRISYSVYLWQQLWTGETAWASASVWLHPLMLVPAVLLSYYAVEQPAIRLGRSLLGERRSRMAPGTRSGSAPR